MNILCTICARGGSKGVKSKNLKDLLGKPLIAWTIEQAVEWGKADMVIVSTDSQEIADVARIFGATVPFLRPDYLATDTAAKLPAIQHAVKCVEKNNNVQFDYIVDLDPTSPLRDIEDLDSAFQMLINNPKANNIYSVCKASKSPYFNMVETTDDGFSFLSKGLDESIVRRQDAPVVYEMNASIYIYRRDFLMATDSIHSTKTLIYEMPQERSVDIDSEFDFLFVKNLLREKSLNKFNVDTYYKSIFNLKGKIVVVTGAAGLIGTEMAKGLAEFGATVIAADIAYMKKSTLPVHLKEAIYPVYLDITDQKSVYDLINRLGKIDVWINNAYPRTDDWGANFEDVPFESFQKNVDMHLNGYFLCCQAVAKKMKNLNNGSIINMGSIYGLVGPRFDIYKGTEMTMPVAYSAIKGGIINLTRYLASYLGKYNIRINSIAPGGVFDNQPASFVKAYQNNTPLQRMSKPEDIVGLVVFLASNASEYVTGQTIVVDGGWTIV